MLVFTRQWSESFNPQDRDVLWGQLEGWTEEDYGPHMYVLEIDTSSPNQGFLVTGEEVPNDYTYGLTTCNGKTWISLSPACIRRWKYRGKLGLVAQGRPREMIESIPLGIVGLVAHGSNKYTFEVCGHPVAVCFRSLQVLVKPVMGDIESARKLQKVLTMHLFP